MNPKKILYNNAEWTMENYQTALKMAWAIKTKEIHKFEELAFEKVKFLLKNLEAEQNFFFSLPSKEFHILPFRVYGLAENQTEFELASRNDMKLHGFTVYNKHAFVTLFVFNMLETQLSKDHFIQISVERIYSRKSGSGSRLLKHVVRNANKHNVTLTVWNENEKLKDYFVNHGFQFHFKSLTTGHYFSTLNF